MNKLKNNGLWVAIAALFYLVLEDLGYQIDPTRWETYVTLIVGILISLGVVSNPKEGKWFGDDKHES
ncbi:holin [Cytobacillus sp. FSL H8-0458]|uniref:holin n=1 Tax=Cytobacillus sp. FSL H8-0458 TaxID=2975346 RepID=UPI0030FCBE9D